MSTSTPSGKSPKKSASEAEEHPAPDEGADGLGYTARPTEHEPEGEKSPGGGRDDAEGK